MIKVLLLSKLLRNLFRQWKKLEILKNLELGKREILKKKGKILKSLEDLG
jgi:hypothetical protein